MSPSFFGHIASRVSGSIFHCDSRPALICLCTDVLTGVCPAMSVEGENLGSNNNQVLVGMKAARTYFLNMLQVNLPTLD